MRRIKILLWAALAAFILGAFAPGCGPASDWDGRLCAAPATGGEYCVPSDATMGAKGAWDKAEANGPLPIQMWAEWPEDMTLDELVASPDKLKLWFADIDKVLTHVRVGEKHAESYQASMAGRLGALLAQAKQRQVELLEQKPVAAHKRESGRIPTRSSRSMERGSRA